MIAQYLVHFGYTLQLFALLARDVLWLRGILVCAQSILALYAYMRGPQYLPYVFWNLLFVGINCYWVARLLRERRAVELPPELKSLYEKHFAALQPPEFFRLWQQGERGGMSEGVLVKEGTMPGTLYFLLNGKVSVRRGERELTQLGAGSFVGEMSLLTGDKTTADVVALGPVEYMTWPAAALARLRGNPVLWTRLQSVLGHDLVEKIRATQSA